MINNPVKSQYRVGFIGGGNMAKSIIGGLVPNIVSKDCIHIYDPNELQIQNLEKMYGINRSENNSELVKQSDVLVLAIKPQVMANVLTEIAQDILQKQPLIISIAAGITESTIQKIITKSVDQNTSPSNLPIIRVMPNTPALINAGASGLYANHHVSFEQKKIAEILIGAVGLAIWVDHERDIDTVTALSGSGPAYFMLFIKALIESAKDAGLPSEKAEELAIQTCIGSAKLIQSSDESIQQLIENVTSPGGTTEKAILSFNDNKLEKIVQHAFSAALQRSKELGETLT